MSKIKKIGMVGFGRFSRTLLKQIAHKKDLQVVAIVDSQDAPTLEHLFKYDSVYGKLESAANITNNTLIFQGREIALHLGKSATLPHWKDLGVETVFFDGTHRPVTKEDIETHQAQGADHILVAGDTFATSAKFIPGLSDLTQIKDQSVVQIVSPEGIASAIVLKTLHEKLGIERASITQISSYSANQSLADVQNKDYRLSRAAGANVVPVETNLAQVLVSQFPDLNNKIAGLKCYVPVSSTSCLDVTLEVRSEPSIDEIKKAFEDATSRLKGLVEVSNVPLVSTDYISNPASFTLDAQSISTLDGRLVHLMGWFDETHSYALRCVEYLSN